jgi:hypothetical protein
MREIKIDWPEGVASVLELDCFHCSRKVCFDFTVEDELWLKVVPVEHRRNVCCLPCFDTIATNKRINISQSLQQVQFTGLGKTIVLTPEFVHLYGNDEDDADGEVTPSSDLPENVFE